MRHASMRFQSALDCHNNQVARTQMPDHPLYVSTDEAGSGRTALANLECPACGTSLGINPQDGKLACPNITCCAL